MIIQTIRTRFLSMNFRIFHYLMILFLKFQFFFFRISLQNENAIFEIREKLNENKLTNDKFIQSISLTSTRKKRNKTFSSSFSNRDSRLKIDAITRSNYYKTNNLDIKRIKNIKKSKKIRQYRE